MSCKECEETASEAMSLDLDRRTQLLQLSEHAAKASKELLAISELAAKYASMVATFEPNPACLDRSAN